MPSGLSSKLYQGVSLVCTGFVEIWCLLLPFGLATDMVDVDWISVVAVAIISLLLLAVDEVANQMEDPFQLIPVDDIVYTYERDINRVITESTALREAARSIQAKSAVGETIVPLYNPNSLAASAHHLHDGIDHTIPLLGAQKV